MLEMPQLSLIIAKKQQAQNSNFFYAIQFDDAGHMVNFFFFGVDVWSRMTYQYFGDVVTFDTHTRTKQTSTVCHLEERERNIDSFFSFRDRYRMYYIKDNKWNQLEY